MSTSEGTARTVRATRLSSRPLLLRVLVVTATVAAVVLPVVLTGAGRVRSMHPDLPTGLLLISLSVLSVEIGRVTEGGIARSQRPHKALSAWAFAAALLLPTPWLLPVVTVTYAHARWRGLRVALWKWVGSAAYVALAGATAAVVARAVGGEDPNWMAGNGGHGLLAIGVASGAFLLVETALFHGSAYLNEPEDERWLRGTLRSASFYLTEASVLLIGGLSAAVWTGGSWFLALLVPVYGLAQRAALHEPLREQAERDDKTALLRAETWRRLAVQAARRCSSRRESWSVVFADIDHFKQYNDRHGHLVGDEALLAVADAMRHRLRPCDLLGRFGGEEFCVLLPDADEQVASGIAETLRVAVEGTATPGTPLTVSLGVTTVPAGSHDVPLDHVLIAADRALYDAKLAGRNRVVVHALDLLDPTETGAESPERQPERV